jgi:hypothetical protein
MTINDFIKECKKLFGNDIEYKAVSKDGQVFKTKGYDNAEMEFNKRQSSYAIRQAKRS